MSRRKQFITLFIGLIFFSGVVLLNLNHSNSEVAHSTSQKKVAATQVKKDAATNQSSTAQVKPKIKPVLRQLNKPKR